MAYKVFISHSTWDRGLVISLANLLSKFGVEVCVAEWYLIPEEPLGQKVFHQIEHADCVVVLLTRNGLRSNRVQQEIGYALKTGKRVIPLVEKGTSPRDVAALQMKDPIEYDPSHPEQALLKTSGYVKSLKLRKAEQEKILLVVGSILAFLLLLSGGDE
jgi:nucleoside 2-deoxyribosyltransferase